MPEGKHCVRCERVIDAYARICPYCNWDQNQPAPPPEAKPAAAAPAYVPPEERSWKRHIIIGAIGFAVLLLSFGVGALIQGTSRNKHIEAAEAAAEEEKATGPVKAPPRADVTLVPVTDAGVDAPITSAPVPNAAQGVPTEYQRTDATAVSSVEYAQLAARAQQEKKAAQQRALVDPRSITGAAYNQGAPPPPRPRPMPEPQTSSTPDRPRMSNVTRTNPVPEYQPMPEISVDETSTARLDLIVGSDGRVKGITIRNGIAGQTPKLIATVQRWRFKPATENGVPVSAPFSVDISFRGRD